jgi:hypothetical protein
MAQRLQLQSLLESITANVYFQPPTNSKIEYPCIVYRRNAAKSEHADNLPHIFTWQYEVTVIDRDPDSAIPDSVANLPLCIFNRHFIADNLNHDVFNLYWKGTTA